MRVTQNQMTRLYLRNSNTALTNMNNLNNRILTQRKFTRASQDSVSASKAMIIRRNLQKNEMYSTNLDTAEGIYSTAEKALLSISSISTTISDSIIEGANGTNGPDEKKIVANQIRNLAKEMLSQINSEYADRKLFGGTNNSTTPFVYDEATKTLTFNGVDINSSSLSDFPKTKEISLDIGLGVQFDADGNVDKQTVMNIALNGAEILGYGTDADGDPKNLISIAFKAADALEAGESGKALNLLEKLNASKSKIMNSITNLGNQQQSVDYARSRLENDEYSLKVAQQTVEGIDLTEEITNYKVAQMAYNATLSMGSNLIPLSIFDYIK
jgi:flagellar hook-associated protein 3 FlgL